MIYKLIVVFFISISFVQIPSCNKQEEVKEIFNVNSKVELLFFYTINSSREERDRFYEQILMKPVNGGYWTRDGVQSVFAMDKNSYEGFGITFRQNATHEQREDIKKRIVESSVVYKVYENVTLDEIKDL